MFKTTNQQCIGDHNKPTEESQQKPTSIVEKMILNIAHLENHVQCWQLARSHPVAVANIYKIMENHVFHIGKLTISMAMFNSFVKLAEGMFLAASLIHPNGEKNI